MINTETETVVKKIIPYLIRRGYDIEKDVDFETGVLITDRYTKGYIDILVKSGGSNKPQFLIEAKKISKKLTTKDRDQAISYGKSANINVPFVVVTNGNDIQCFNTQTKSKILWDGKSQEKIPTKEQLKKVITFLKTNPNESVIQISNDNSLPFRPGLALRQLNALFLKCHSTIRKMEKNEENIFSDFSKLLFLKLLEEKEDLESDFTLPYSYRFHELSKKSFSDSDQVKDATLSMIDKIIAQKSYGDVLKDKISLKNPKTFHSIIKDLAEISFCDCSLDSKGAAFEYFVRATLKGKKLGQYFTPRELVQVMLAIIGQRKIVNAVTSGSGVKILDPACGTGGFLVFLMQDTLNKISEMYKTREITKKTFEDAIKKVKEEIFFGSDANEGVAASAKMNMIIAGDGHTNIQNEDSLAASSKNWNVTSPDCDIILTNPPFGTSEDDSLSSFDKQQFPIKGSKGQHLFLQKMVLSAKPGSGEICTVIDEGVLNTESAAPLRKWLLQHCRLKAVFNLPGETFKPNKINVKSSLLYLQRRETPDLDFEDIYNVTVCKFNSLGYDASGDKIRGFDFDKMLLEISLNILDINTFKYKTGYHWEAFDIQSTNIVNDRTFRLDYKYWNIDVNKKIDSIYSTHNIKVRDINTIITSRGKSPAAENYVDEAEGFAVVVKSGSNITKNGKINIAEADWIEKSSYDEFIEEAEKSKQNKNIILKGDILLASTGEGTLGKAAVYELDIPAIADGHVTIIRVDPNEIDPYYLCDYLRSGFGSMQIDRLFTGSTGLIELTPDQVDSIVIDMRDNIVEQKKLSQEIRTLEDRYLETLETANEIKILANEVLNKI